MDPAFTNLIVFILLSVMSSGLATTSSKSQAALDARARLSVMRFQRIVKLQTLFYDFDYENLNLELKRSLKQELELKEEIKNLDPQVNFLFKN